LEASYKAGEIVGGPSPVFRLKRAIFSFVFRSKKAQISIYISFDCKKFRGFRWFRNEIRENSQKYPAPPRGIKERKHDGKVKNGASRITEAQMRFKARFSLRKVFLSTCPSNLHFIHALLHKQGRAYEIYARCFYNFETGPEGPEVENFARNFSCGSKRN
jgi:hypothetical protein